MATDLKLPSGAAAVRAVPVRHHGRWIAATVVTVLGLSAGYSLLTNPNLDVPTIRAYLFQDFVLDGVGVTLLYTAVAMVLGTAGAVVIAVMRLSANPVLRGVSWLFVWFFRGTPLLVQIIFLGFLGALYPRLTIGVPFTDVVFVDAATSSVMGAATAAVLALTLNEMAYAAEIVRGGILSVDRGQVEAAHALGMPPVLTMRRVVLPQAMRVIVPPMGNETITMLKSTALVAVIGGKDLLTAVQNVYAQNFKTIPLLTVAALWYLLLVSVLSAGQYFLERRFGRGSGDVPAARGALDRWLGIRSGKGGSL